MYNSNFLVSRNNGVPPAPPTLIVAKATHSIISLSWTPPSVDGGAPITAYRLHHHRWTLKMDFYLKDYLLNKSFKKIAYFNLSLSDCREFGDWDRLDILPSNTTYTFEGLRCGTNYQFYIQV